MSKLSSSTYLNERMPVRLEEHKHSISSQQTTSAVFQYHLNTRYENDFPYCKQDSSCMHKINRLIWKAIEIEKNATRNRKEIDAFIFYNLWKVVLDRETFAWTATKELDSVAKLNQSELRLTTNHTINNSLKITKESSKQWYRIIKYRKIKLSMKKIAETKLYNTKWNK